MLRNIIRVLNNEQWSDICNKCYHIKYKDYDIIEIPKMEDSYIRGYISSGILYQFCFINQDCGNDELSKRLEDTLRAGIEELITCGKQIKDLGIEKVKEWHLVTQEYRDRRILECCEQVRKSVQGYCLEYISDNFRVFIKTEEDFLEEMKWVISNDDTYKLEFSYSHSPNIDLDEFPSEKVANIRRKLKAIIGKEITNENENRKYDRLVKMYVSYYNQGIIILNRLRENCPMELEYK